MKLTAFLFLTCCLHVAAIGVSQTVTFSGKDVPLEKVFSEVKKQTGFVFFFDADLLKDAKPVSVKAENLELEAFLSSLFKDQPLKFSILDKAVIVSRKPVVPSLSDDKKVLDFLPPGPIKIFVTDADGKPLDGATITVKKSRKSGVTGAEGVSTLNLEAGDVIVVSYVGFEPKEFTIKNNTTSLVISLQQATAELDEAIVVAYNTTTQRRNTGSVTIVKGEQIAALPNRSFDKSLQGLVPGLQVTQGTGQPGGGVANFVLRGIATGGNPADGSTVRNPLIVVDGVPVFQDQAQGSTSLITFNNPMAQLNPSDIETISVLKDAAAIALYGSKASNGVILINTKKGKAGKATFGFRHQTDVSTRLKGNVEMLNQQQYLELLYETYKNTDPVYWTDARIQSDLFTKFPYYISSGGDTTFYPASDWISALYNPKATTVTNEISITGGNEKSNYYFNVEYTKQNGVEKTTGYDRKSMRFNYETRPHSWIKVGLNSTISFNTQNYSSPGWSERTASLISPLNPIYAPNNDFIYNYTWGFSNSSNLISNNTFYHNPVAAHKLNINRNLSYRGLSKLYGEVRFLKDFTFIPTLGVDFMLTEAKEKVHPRLAGSGGGLMPGIGRLNENDVRNANFITTNILRYDKRVGTDHSINFLLGQEAQILTNKFMYVLKENLTANPTTDQLTAGTVKDAGGVTSKQTLLSYFGQLNYGLKDKYLLTSSIRRDGSSLFGVNRRFGTHWSSGVAWIVTEESFMKGVKPFLNYFKLRGSIGSAGNSSAILNTLQYDRLVMKSYLDGTSAVYPDPLNRPGNPDIRWEKTFTWDAGVELRAFDERILVTADIYSRKTSDVIGEINLPSGTGYFNLRTNIGDIQNKGTEISIMAAVIKNRFFQWNISANWSTNKNVLTKSFYPLELTSSSTSTLANAQDQNYNSFYLVRWAGVDPASGKPQWIDSTGKVTTQYSDAKREFVGKPQPDAFGSIINTWTYKGIELSAMLYYQYGYQIYGSPSNTVLVNDGVTPYVNQSVDALDRWQKPGDNAKNPRRLLFGQLNGISDNGTDFSTRYLANGNFIRLSNVSIAYSLPNKLIDQVHLRVVKFYFQVSNLATWTAYQGQDPEYVSSFGTAQYTYPLQRTLSLGLNVNF